MHLLCVLMTRYFWKPSMSRRSSNEQQNRERRSGSMRVGVCIPPSLNIHILLWVTVRCGPGDECDTRRGVAGVSSVIRLRRVSHDVVDREEQHQSPRPPTRSLGMMRSSEPCFRNTLPATKDRAPHKGPFHSQKGRFVQNSLLFDFVGMTVSDLFKPLIWRLNVT